jgi:galactose oxidase
VPPRAAVPEPADGLTVVVGLTSNCPYGLGACWGGAHEALHHLQGVGAVNPEADTEDSTAQVTLAHTGLPPVAQWAQQFRAIVNQRYEWRGVEITLQGAVEEHNGSLILVAAADRPAIELSALTGGHKIQFDNTVRARKPLDAQEASAFARIAQAVKKNPSGHPFTVTGPLEQTPSNYVLHVRQFSS